MEKQNKNDINGAIIEEENLLDSFKHASATKEKFNGRFALIPDLLNAKSNLVDLDYEGDKIISTDLDNTVTPSVIFYGKTRKNTPILVVNNNIGEMLEENPIILERSKLYTNPKISMKEDNEIRLNPSEFECLVSGRFGEVSIIDYATYSKKLKERGRGYDLGENCISLNLEEAMNDEITKALIPKDRKRILNKLLKVTEETIKGERGVEEYKKFVKEKYIDRNTFLKIIHLESVVDYGNEVPDYLNYTGRFIGLSEVWPQRLSYKNDRSCNSGSFRTGIIPFSIDFDKKVIGKANFVLVKDEKLLEKAIPTQNQLRYVLDTAEFWITDHRLIHEWIKEYNAKR